MNAIDTQAATNWETICSSSDLSSMLGVRAMFGGEQVALFKVKDKVYAVSAIDPFSNSAVMARGIVGDVNGQVVVASPLYKQHFNLETGVCLEDGSVGLKTYCVREIDGKIELSNA